jgi:hypothetical protein
LKRVANRRSLVGMTIHLRGEAHFHSRLIRVVWNCRSLGFPGFPVELGGFDQLHAPFLTERRTSGPVLYCVAGNPGSLGMTKGRGALPFGVNAKIVIPAEEQRSGPAFACLTCDAEERTALPFVIPSEAEGSAVLLTSSRSTFRISGAATRSSGPERGSGTWDR